MKIYISYSHKDKEIVKLIHDRLISVGHMVFWDNDISFGSSVLETLNRELLDADVLLAIISDNYINSKSANSELMKAFGFNELRNKPKVLPYVIGNPENLPINIKGIVYLRGSDDYEKDLQKIILSLEKINGTILAEDQIKTEEKEEVNKSFDSYITDVFSVLNTKERQNRRISYFCYIVSALFLGLAVFTSLLLLHLSDSDEIAKIIQSLFRNVAIVAFILALARMMFVLGKSFMVESIRNGDRIHAISFGKFFMKAYGNKASRAEIREVFGEWNIDSGSSFIAQTPNDIDPQVIGALQILMSALKK